MTKEEEFVKLKENVDTLIKWGYQFYFMKPGESVRGNGIKEVVISHNATDVQITSVVDKAVKDANSFYNALHSYVLRNQTKENLS